jgi:hypothetical protein
MDLREEVRLALQPLIDRGIVNDVQDASFMGEGRILVVVDTPNPKHRLPEIKRLLHAAGLESRVRLALQSTSRG